MFKTEFFNKRTYISSESVTQAITTKRFGLTIFSYLLDALCYAPYTNYFKLLYRKKKLYIAL